MYNPAFSAAAAFDSLVYGETHPGTMQFLQNQISNIGDSLSEAGRSFLEKGRDLFEQYHSSAALQFARETVKKVKGAFETKYICSIWDMKGFQSAPMVMQRWVMANPVVREMYHAQRCDGYSDTYIDVHEKDIGEKHYDYRRVMDGVLVFDEKDHYHSTHYLDELIEGDRDLLHSEKNDILKTWDALEYLLALGGEDPTSNVGDTL
jgi:hypothetical protein